MGDSLGDRMKKYERISQSDLMRRTPVIVRLDGKAFHTYTRGCDKPFDMDLHQIRQQTLQHLCETIQGCIIGYSQSDELSLVLKDWDTYDTSAWFDNNLQKIVSVTASECTARWNELVYMQPISETPPLASKVRGFAKFDSRAFNVPKEEVINYLIWRQGDWERNSVQMLARAYYSHKQCHGKSCKELITLIEQEHNIVWGNLATWKKQGETWIRGVGIVDDVVFKLNRSTIDKLVYDELVSPRIITE